MTPDELRAQRKSLRLSQTALAEALGVAQNTVSRWEIGTIVIDGPRSVWLDQEMQRIGRERKPKRRRRPARPAAGGEEGEG